MGLLTLALEASGCDGIAKQAGEYYFAPELGTRVGETSTFELGRGNVGTAYRIFDAAKHSYEIKAYRDLKRYYDRETGQWGLVVLAKTSCATDLLFFRLFREAPADSLSVPPVTETTHEGAPALRFGRALWGKSVYKLLEDKSLPSEVRDYIAKQHRKRLEAFAEYLRREFKGAGGVETNAEATDAHKYPFIKMTITFSDERSSTTTQVHIAADGILVDASTLDFHLVDPN